MPLGEVEIRSGPERNGKGRGREGLAMVITVRRNFPWFPVALAIGWVLMMSLTVRDLGWFARFSSALGDPIRPTATAHPVSSAAPIKTPLATSPCAAAIAPLARIR
jgi:hypothetical protein